MIKCIIIVLVQIKIIYVNGWVINNMDLQAVTKYKLEKLEGLNGLALSAENDDINVKFTLIYPGTKWCGAGDIASNFNDLGSEWRTDMCCRDHDHCPDTIPAGETKYNLTNEAFYTRLSCDCDETFRKCLRSANSFSAENVGVFYFNALNTKCYRKDYPVKRCLKRGGWLNKKCLVHSYNTTAEQIHQWFDVNNYR